MGGGGLDSIKTNGCVLDCSCVDLALDSCGRAIYNKTVYYQESDSCLKHVSYENILWFYTVLGERNICGA